MSIDEGRIRDSLVSCHNSQGLELRGTVLQLTRYSATFEVYGAVAVMRTSEVLGNFRIVINDRTIYAGRAVVGNIISTALMTTCEVSLDEGSWMNVSFNSDMIGNGQLRAQFLDFIQDWQKLYRLEPEYKIAVSDIHSFLSEMRLWLEQVELGIRSSPSADRVRLEREVSAELAQPVIPCINALFEKFERVAEALPKESLPAHRNYMRRQLHPLVLCSPFAHRTYEKPLGYAGDYEMVDMILRNGQDGSSLFSKVVNSWFLHQPPAKAHRNRIAYLTQRIADETLRVRCKGRPARILSVGCGPAQEIQAFFRGNPLKDSAEITLLDFSEEAIQHASSLIETARREEGCRAVVKFQKKSVQQILKESGRSVGSGSAKQYDFVYCAGLFDYLSDSVCRRLMDVMYDWLTPGGVVVATNVEPSNPLRNGMEHLLDWYLIYRTAGQLRSLAPARAADTVQVLSEDTGVNLFLELRKPEDG